MPATKKKVVSIIQSSYIPWKGYFDIIDQSDAFILLDDVQYTKRDWRSRNKIPTANGEKWLTVPVKVKGKYYQKICDVEVSDPKWHRSHWGTIENAYRTAPFFNEMKDYVEDLYLSAGKQSLLSEINFHFIQNICNMLRIGTPLTWSMDYGIETEDPTERLVQLCLAENATTYISGPAARAYLDETMFERHGIKVRYFEYGQYPAYKQQQKEFNHFVSVLDMLFMCGPETMQMIRNRKDNITTE